jgi:hypothetical protein
MILFELQAPGVTRCRDLADKSAGTTTDFLAYCNTMRLKGFFRPCDGEKILVKEFSSGQLSH